MRRLGLVLLAVLLLLTLGACSSSGGKRASTSSSSPIIASTASITIDHFAYSGDLSVSPGAKVTVTNKDTVPHTLTDKATLLFDTGSIAPGRSATFSAPGKPGRYPFGCRFHAEMKATLTVR